jgi:hypothetical protein
MLGFQDVGKHITQLSILPERIKHTQRGSATATLAEFSRRSDVYAKIGAVDLRVSPSWLPSLPSSSVRQTRWG